jgi:hypothetical protein
MGFALLLEPRTAPPNARVNRQQQVSLPVYEGSSDPGQPTPAHGCFVHRQASFLLPDSPDRRAEEKPPASQTDP